jgi:hypothetical protein
MSDSPGRTRTGLALGAAALSVAACGSDAVTDHARAYVALHADHAHVVDARALKHRVVASLSGGAPEPIGLSGAVLAREIARRTNIEFLLDGLGPGYRDRVDVTLTPVAREGDHTSYELVVQDPALPGPIHAHVLAPAASALELSDDGELTAAPGSLRPGVVLGLHGHGQAPDGFARDHLGNELADRGFLVVIPLFEPHACGDSEAATSALLLEHGFTLIGIWAYQSLAVLELSSGWDAIAPAGFGILAHSGGSVLARLVTPLTDRVVARVLDHESLYNGLCSGQIHCETVPDLYQISGDINAADAPPATLEVPYGFPGRDVRAAIVRFFEDVIR